MIIQKAPSSPKRNQLPKLLKAFAVVAIAPLIPHGCQTARVAFDASEENFTPDAMIVVTGYNKRILFALEEFTKIENSQKILLISGVHSETSIKDLEAALSKLKGSPISFAGINVVLGKNAPDTFGNAQEIVCFLAEHPAIQKVDIVTSFTHRSRLSLELNRALPENMEVRYTASDSMFSNGLRPVYVEAVKITGAAIYFSGLWHDIRYGGRRNKDKAPENNSDLARASLTP